jgi:predicted Fe-Mo cluster-binding NifX family protein
VKIAVPTRDWETVAGHAGQARHWLLWDLATFGAAPGAPLPAPVRIELAEGEVLHHFQDDRPHPLDGVDRVIAGSVGDGFVRHMKKRGAEVVSTGESDPVAALTRLAAGETLADRKFDITTSLCRLRDIFTRY